MIAARAHAARRALLHTTRAARNHWDSMRAREDAAAVPRVPEASYARLGAGALRRSTRPPVCSRVLVRDFIHDALYNPVYGYFSRRAVIVSADWEIDFNAVRDEFALTDVLARLYQRAEGAFDLAARDSQRQVWHTPTELFKPWYGYAVAKYLIAEHRRSAAAAAGQPLRVYEVGAGNGTLMANILDFARTHEPEVYATLEYTVVEISAQLADVQGRAVGRVKAKSVTSGSSAAKDQDREATFSNDTLARRMNEHAGRVRIVNKSILEWDQRVEEPCFVLALEVVDNFAHDLIRVDTETDETYQGIVSIDEHGDFAEEYEQVTDPLLRRFLDTRRALGIKGPLERTRWRRKLRNTLPFAPNLSEAEFVPTHLFRMLEVLRDKFPRHRLALFDFDYLPDAVPGHNAPVVQTRHQKDMVACSTYMVQQGWFDIFFPTDFALLARMYREVVCGGGGNSARDPRVMKQAAFLRQHADLARTATQSGENPMLTYYANMSVFVS